jgi:ABC-2 type transport system permease protein
MIMIFMVYVFGGQQTTVTLYYADHDNSATSHAFLGALNSTGAFQLQDGSGMNLNQSLEDGKIMMYLEIPAGFEGNISTQAMSNSSYLQVYYDKSKVAALPAVSAIEQVADQFSMQMIGAKPLVSVIAQDITTNSMSYGDFLLPGVVGMTIMMSCVNGTVSACAKNRSRGVFRKLATTPISKVEWNASRILTQTITLLMSVAVSLTVGWLLFQITPQINILTVSLVVCGGVLFAGLGTILAVFVRDEDAAIFAASAISFPLMFVSGSFTTVDTLPGFMKVVAALSPLTYLNNGLRSAMVTGNFNDALMNLLVVLLGAAVLFTLGVILLRWKDD